MAPGSRPLAIAVARDPDQTAFVVSFDDRAISLASPDGSTDSARFDELDILAILPDDDPYLIWTGPFFVVLHVRGRRRRIPAFAVGLEAFLGRLLELPGIDRYGPKPCCGRPIIPGRPVVP